jgi:Flp pilus assembly protein TadD
LDTGDPAASPDVMDRLLAEQIRRHQTVLIERPQHADLHYRLGVLLRHAGRLPEAIAAFRRAVQINPTYAKALVKLGLALHAAGQSQEAIDILRRAIHLRPDDAPLHYELGLMFADRRDFALAIEQFEDAVRRAPHNLDFHANLALALQNMGLIDRASACWRTFSDLIAVGPAPPPHDRASDPEP